MNNNKIVISVIAIAAVFICCIYLCGVLVIKLISLIFGKDILYSTKGSRGEENEDISNFRYKEKKDQERRASDEARDIERAIDKAFMQSRISRKAENNRQQALSKEEREAKKNNSKE
ncbi:hypothetical protein F0310_04700 (plasmid) [Borrelia sp. A-FGy1]|uniref:hypothetical protein n=1 Tax=Borrelia sp. A-FGy1 TaxID=2608247 RepID=UPI0015F63EB3|nr:hypothetical protein [Borrelia sp. A-FGy1]QMU99716.1 hypothetical protein F0310_04700 [Borrelia sp. A-FGy1]